MDYELKFRTHFALEVLDILVWFVNYTNNIFIRDLMVNKNNIAPNQEITLTINKTYKQFLKILLKASNQIPNLNIIYGTLDYADTYSGDIKYTKDDNNDYKSSYDFDKSRISSQTYKYKIKYNDIEEIYIFLIWLINNDVDIKLSYISLHPFKRSGIFTTNKKHKYIAAILSESHNDMDDLKNINIEKFY